MDKTKAKNMDTFLFSFPTEGTLLGEVTKDLLPLIFSYWMWCKAGGVVNNSSFSHFEQIEEPSNRAMNTNFTSAMVLMEILMENLETLVRPVSTALVRFASWPIHLITGSK